MSGFVPYSHEGIGTEDYMCPFCVTPWKCNGPHVEWDDLDNYNGALEDAYAQGLSDAAATTEAPLIEQCLDLMGCERDCNTRDAERTLMLRVIELVRSESSSDGSGTGSGAVGRAIVIKPGMVARHRPSGKFRFVRVVEPDGFIITDGGPRWLGDTWAIADCDFGKPPWGFPKDPS